jgi:hypothetical protein
MEVNEMWNLGAFVFSCIGAVAVQVLHWLAVSRSNRWPKYSKSAVQWILSVLLVIIAGFLGLAVFYSRPFDPLVAFGMGVSAPSLIQQAGQVGLPAPEQHLGEERAGFYEQFYSFFRF